MKQHFAITLSIFIVIAVPATLVSWYLYDISENRGFSFGYYGDYNRTKKYLKAIDNIKIVDEWSNMDITLEEFGFWVVYKGETVKLFFSESDETRNMSRSDAITELKYRLETGPIPVPR